MKTEYQLTIMDAGHLPRRLIAEVRFVEDELKRAWPDMKRDPLGFVIQGFSRAVLALKRLLLAPNIPAGILTAFLVMVSVVLIVRVLERSPALSVHTAAQNEDSNVGEVVTLTLVKTNDADLGVGLKGKGRVGFERDKGGLRDPVAAQNGKPPQPSLVAAEIPKLPPLNKANLPAAGIDIDPALWQDLKAPVYGDPRSTSHTPSNGPGEEGGMGTNKGIGIGDGKGPGVGPGEDGNIGGGQRQSGSRGSGGSSGNNPNGQPRVLRGSEVEQRARLLSKPEPQYTEEARRNQVTGTVVLRVVFSSMGEVVDIHAVQLLPFGLTERAIAAARQIRFLPATRGGQPVSGYMQLEYNFNLY